MFDFYLESCHTFWSFRYFNVRFQLNGPYRPTSSLELIKDIPGGDTANRAGSNRCSTKSPTSLGGAGNCPLALPCHPPVRREMIDQEFITDG